MKRLWIAPLQMWGGSIVAFGLAQLTEMHGHLFGLGVCCGLGIVMGLRDLERAALRERVAGSWK